MRKNYCDKCGEELTSCTGHEHINIKLGMAQGVYFELCATHAQELKKALSDFLHVRIDWHIAKGGGNGCG